MPQGPPHPPPRTPQAPSPLPQAPSRRLVLGASAALALPWLAGCAERRPPSRDVGTLTAAIAAEQDLVATYEAARAANAPLAGRLDPILAHHREHLAVLRRHHVPGSGDRAHEGGRIPAPRTEPLPQGGGAVLAALRRLEARAAAARLADTRKVEPGLAQLLACIGACEAGHAGTVRVADVPDPAKSDAQALRTALEAEHAAVYGYGVLGSRLGGALQANAKAAWNAHRAQRDRLETIVAGDPVAAAPVYALPVQVTSARTAAQLAAALEDELVRVYVALAGASGPKLRVLAAGGAQTAMTRAGRWRAATGDRAPTSAFPGLPAAALPPAPQPGE